MQHFFWVVLLVLSVNIVAGFLGLQLAISPGYATAVWPPSGVALASVLIWRSPGVVGVWLASFLVGILNQNGFSLPSLSSGLSVAWIASASAAQALLGAFLVRRYVGYPSRLNNAGDIIRFLFLAGPVACLVSATLSVGYLVSSGMMAFEGAQINWLTWWVGDTIGVIVFTPLMFLAFALPRRYWRSQRLSVGLPLVLITFFTIIMYRQGLEKEEEIQKNRFEGQARAFALAVQTELEAHISQLYNLRGFLYSDFDLSPADFERFADEALQRRGSLHGLSWDIYLKGHERDGFVRHMRNVYGSVPFTIQERHPAYGLVRAENRDSYVVVTLIEPFDVNQAALGFDVLSDPLRREALEKAVQSGLASATAPIRLVQENEEQKGVLIFLPAFHSKSTPDSEGERLDALAGYGVAVVRMADLVNEVIRRHELQQNEVKLYPKGLENQPYYVSEGFSNKIKDKLVYRSEIRVGTDIWVMDQWVSRQLMGYSWGLYFVLIGGFFVSAALGGVLLVQAGRSAEVSREVHLRTRELQKSNELLAESQRIAQMGSWEWEHNGRPHQWSNEFYRLLGLKPGAHVASDTLFLQQVVPDQVSLVEQALEAALRGKRLDIECTLRSENGSDQRHLSLKGERVLMGGSNASGNHFLSIVARDITEQRQSAQALELAAITFETHESIVITDADTVIQRVNSAFCQITGYRSDEVLGCKISILKSGRHGNNFYRKLWQTLTLKGHWHGEIWNKRKDGSVFPELVTITAVDTLGQGYTTHYVAAFLDITDKKASEERIRYLAYYDSITALPNRDLFMESLRHQLMHCERHHDFSTLMFMDLDDFKMLNDSLGHDMGDELLKAVAERLSTTLRAEDIFSRFGGDEFLFLLPGEVDAADLAMDQAAHVAERILQSLEEPFDLKGHRHKVSASIGITYLPQPEVEAEGYIQQADTAMYRAKSAGKAAFAFYEPEMQVEVMHRLELEKSIRTALEEDQFRLFYQPQHDSNGAMIGCEALIRWQHPEEGLIGPGSFICIAEESTIIIDIGMAVLEKACHQMQAWKGTALGHCKVSVNISSRHFAHPDFVSQVEFMLAKYPAAKGLLWIEITEGVFLKSGQDLNTTLRHLAKLGVRCSIDDFGTGYSSLGYLKNLKIDQIKIAQEFVQDLVNDEKDAQLVKAILQMGLSLGLDLVAEGVETEAQYNFLKELGCPCYQGYWFARPMPADELLGYSAGLQKRGV